MNEIQLRCRLMRDGMCILQTYSNLTCITVPDSLGGIPVTEIGPYCFSPSRPDNLSETDSFFSIQSDDHCPAPTAGRSDGTSLPPTDGKYLEKVFLPPSVKTLHNAAFYNCRKLIELAVGPSLTAIGSDEFTNCLKLNRIYYNGPDTDASALSLLLNRLETDVEVFLTDSRSPDHSGNVRGALFFPEYYEWLDEVSPAHLFSRSINGEGFRMRKCFQNGQIDYRKYDACYENALKTESDHALCRIALFRLRWPAGLEPDRKVLYEKAMISHFDTAVSLTVSTKDLESLRYLYSGDLPAADAFAEGIRQCILSDWSEGTALLMELRHLTEKQKDKSYEFEDW